MSDKINEIYRTNDYGMFKRLEGNRAVSETRVNKIIKSIERVGYVQSPICVNEKNEVIDGQGRLEALKRLGLPVDYFRITGVSVEECIALNIYQANWSMKDYIDSYAETGNNSYIYLQQLMKAYDEMTLRVIYNALTGKSESGSKTIKDGNFQCQCDDYNDAVKVLEYEKRLQPYLRRVRGSKEYYYISAAFCFYHSGIDNNRLIDKIGQMQAELIPVANIEQALGVIERIYNNRAREKVYLITDYKKTLEAKYPWYEKKHGGKR